MHVSVSVNNKSIWQQAHCIVLICCYHNASKTTLTIHSAPICSSSHLSQHLVILNLVAFGPADFPLQSVLVEPSTDVDQKSRGTGVDSTAEDQVTHAGGHMDAEPQDHTHQQAFMGERGQMSKTVIP